MLPGTTQVRLQEPHGMLYVFRVAFRILCENENTCRVDSH